MPALSELKSAPKLCEPVKDWYRKYRSNTTRGTGLYVTVSW
jgi:hypothetical protein